MSNPFIPNLANKTTPVGADLFIIADSQDSNNEKNTSITQVITNNNVVTATSALTSSKLPVTGSSNQIKSSGIGIDTSNNLTSVGTINSVDITHALLKENNLSDVSSAATSRTNLGLGNAAVKTVTDNTQTNVASAKGAFTIGHVLVAADTSGTVQDGGSASQFLVSSNNLSDVAVKQTSFNNISPCTTAGDLIVFDGTNNVRLAGSSTDNYVLTYDSSQTDKMKWAPVPSPGDAVRVVTTSTTLTSADFGKTIICKSASPLTLTLPAASAGTNNFIYIVADMSSNAIVTVEAVSGNINGQTSVLIGLYDSISVMTDGTNYLIVEQSLYPVTLQAYASSQQTLATNSATQIQFNTPTYDVGGSLNTSTYVVKPLWPGKYEIYYQFILVAPTTTVLLQPKINFNNSLSSTAYKSINGIAALGGDEPVMLTYMSQCNGSTDNFTFIATQQSTDSSSQLVNNNPAFTYIQMKRVSLF